MRLSRWLGVFFKGIAPQQEAASSSARTLLHLVNIDLHFHKHLLPLMGPSLAAGHRVHVAGAVTDPACIRAIEAAGMLFHPIPFARSGIAPWHMMREWVAVWRLIWKIRPDWVRTSTWKPLCAMGVLRPILPRLAVRYAIVGLGFVFLNSSPKARLARGVMQRLLPWMARARSTSWEVLNQQDAQWLHLLVGPSVRVDVLMGLGVDTAHYRPLPLPEAPPYVCALVARLLWDKGIGEFVEAARWLREAGDPVRMVLVGPLDPENPRGITQVDLDGWVQAGLVEYWGVVEDVRPIWAQAHLCVLPSYREGLSMSLIEAAACGRAIIASDVAGCREAVEEGRTGRLVPSHAAQPLVAAIRSYLADPLQVAQHGAAGRERAERLFDMRHTQQHFLDAVQRDCAPSCPVQGSSF